jgi:RNA polymerase sigma-70 factor (ECF subfamily)
MSDENRRIDIAEAAFRTHRGAVFRYLLRRTRSYDEAEELTQAVFADAAARLPTLERAPESMLAWLFTVAERRFTDEIRRKSRWRRRVHLFFEREALDLPEYGVPAAQAITKAIAGLPPEHRKVVTMRLFDDRPFAEIAVVVGASEAACKMRFGRALEAMREELTAQGFTP